MQGVRSARRVPSLEGPKRKRKPKAPPPPQGHDEISRAVDALIKACAAAVPGLGEVGSPVVAAVASLADVMWRIIKHDDAAPARPVVAAAHKYLKKHYCYAVVTEADLVPPSLSSKSHALAGQIQKEWEQATKGLSVSDRVPLGPYEIARTRREVIRRLVHQIDGIVKRARARGENALSQFTQRILEMVIAMEFVGHGTQPQLPGTTGPDFARKLKAACARVADAEGILRTALVGCGLPRKQAETIVQSAMARNTQQITLVRRVVKRRASSATWAS